MYLDINTYTVMSSPNGRIVIFFNHKVGVKYFKNHYGCLQYRNHHCELKILKFAKVDVGMGDDKEEYKHDLFLRLLNRLSLLRLLPH